METENRVELSPISIGVEKITNEIGKIVVGQSEVVELLIIALLTEGHVLLEGVPGVAKTLTAKLLAKTINTEFSRIQFTPDLMPSDILGTSIYNQKSGEFEFKAGPIFSNLVLADEINRAPAKTQAALFEVMEEQQVTIDGVKHVFESPFMVLATQNPVEQEGTYRLPEAQLDRFLFKIKMGYPTLEEEVSIINAFHGDRNSDDPSAVSSVIDTKEIVEMQKVVDQVKLEPSLVKYIASIVQETRSNAGLYLGASPRASIALLKSSKALAAVRGRDFVIPEDIKFLAKAVLNHRVILTPEKEMEGLTSSDIIDVILDIVEVPR